MFLQDGGAASEAVWLRVAKQYYLDKSLGARQETAVSYLFVSISVGRYFHKSLPFLEAGISYSLMVLASMLAECNMTAGRCAAEWALPPFF